MRHLLRTCRICTIWRESYDRCLDVSSGYCSNQNRLLYLLSFPFRFEKDENKCIHSLGRVLFVYETHYLVSFLAGLYWSVVITAFAEPQQFQLIIKTEFGLGGYQSSAGIGIPPTLLMPALQNLVQTSAEPNLFGLCRVPPRLDESQIQFHLQFADFTVTLLELFLFRIF